MMSTIVVDLWFGNYDVLGGIDLNVPCVISRISCLLRYLLLLYIIGFSFRNDLG